MPNSRKGSDAQGKSSKRGFAAMDAKKQREIASKGGKASHGGSSDREKSR